MAWDRGFSLPIAYESPHGEIQSWPGWLAPFENSSFQAISLKIWKRGMEIAHSRSLLRQGEVGDAQTGATGQEDEIRARPKRRYRESRGVEASAPISRRFPCDFRGDSRVNPGHLLIRTVQRHTDTGVPRLSHGIQV